MNTRKILEFHLLVCLSLERLHPTSAIDHLNLLGSLASKQNILNYRSSKCKSRKMMMHIIKPWVMSLLSLTCLHRSLRLNSGVTSKAGYQEPISISELLVHTLHHSNTFKCRSNILPTWPETTINHENTETAVNTDNLKG